MHGSDEIWLSRHHNSWTLLTRATIHGVEVPQGFTTNGASVPRPFWWFLHPAGRAFEAAIVHDWRSYGQGRPGLDADLEFYYNLRKCGVGPIRARVAYRAVRFYTRWVDGVRG